MGQHSKVADYSGSEIGWDNIPGAGTDVYCRLHIVLYTPEYTTTQQVDLQ
jgi:hypothetical protein